MLQLTILCKIIFYGFNLLTTFPCITVPTKITIKLYIFSYGQPSERTTGFMYSWVFSSLPLNLLHPWWVWTPLPLESYENESLKFVQLSLCPSQILVFIIKIPRWALHCLCWNTEFTEFSPKRKSPVGDLQVPTSSSEGSVRLCPVQPWIEWSFFCLCQYLINLLLQSLFFPVACSPQL